MEAFKNRELGVYNTDINIIGSLKDCSVIIKAIASNFDESDSVDELMNERNEFNLRTDKSRKRIEASVNKSFLQFKNQDHEDLIKAIFSDRVPQQDKELALLWQFALNNQLFLDLTSHVFVKNYYSGRIGISKDDIIAYLKEFISQNKSLDISWSENTINIIGAKYLNLMSKLGFLNTGRDKTFKHIRPSSEVQVLFLYFANLYAPNQKNILTNDFLPIGFIHSDDLQARLKKLSLKGFFNLTFNGVDLNIELTHSYKGICDALYN
jgi:hypothetical protein